MLVRPAAATVGALLVLLLTACASGAGAPSRSASPDRPTVVASTDVWGDVVRAVGGDAVTVHSLIQSPDQDPHEYQATVRDQLAVREAALVVENGGGYDDFMTRLGRGRPAGVVLNAADVSGYDQHPPTGEFNEHLWYDVATVGRVATAVAQRLEGIVPAERAGIRTRLARFERSLRALAATEATIRRTAEGKGVAITEPVPLYLTEACGLVNRTDPGFSEAVEEGEDVAPAALRRQVLLLQDHRVALLAVNVQTEDATTDRVVAAARTARVSVVVFRETLPDGQDYLSWMRSELAAVQAAVR